jgi:hypothetical protein
MIFNVLEFGQNLAAGHPPDSYRKSLAQRGMACGQILSKLQLMYLYPSKLRVTKEIAMKKLNVTKSRYFLEHFTAEFPNFNI